jgi:hypothetical protein
MPFVDKIAPRPYKERMHLRKWNDDEDIGTATPYEEIVVEVWYDEYNNEITDPTRIAELEQKLLQP